MFDPLKPAGAPPVRPSYEPPPLRHDGNGGGERSGPASTEARPDVAPGPPSGRAPASNGAARWREPAPTSRNGNGATTGVSSSGRETVTPPVAVDAAALAGWRRVLLAMAERRQALASVLEHAAILEFSIGGVLLAYEQGSFLAVHATEKPARDLLDEVLREHFGAPVEVRFDTIKNGSAASVAQLEAADKRVKMDAARRAIAQHPLVNAAIELLGAELRDVKLGEELAS